MIEDSLPVLRSYEHIPLERLYWLWPDRIPSRKITMIVGNPGLGKSMFTLFLAAQVSQGPRWPDIPGMKEEVGSVIILTTEDAPSDTIKARLIAADADLSKIKELKSQDHKGGDEYEQRPMYDLTNDLPVLERAIVQMEDVRLIIVDPITGYLGGQNENSNAEVRQFMTPLAELAEKHELAIVGISHLNKKQDIGVAYRTLGSMGFSAASRAVWLVAKDNEEKGKRYMLPIKGNLDEEPTGMIFRLVTKYIPHPDGMPMKSVVCEFEADGIDVDPDEILAGKSVESPRDKAIKWLRVYLEDGPVFAKELKIAAIEDGIASATLDRAKKQIGVRSYRVKGIEETKWMWEL